MYNSIQKLNNEQNSIYFIYTVLIERAIHNSMCSNALFNLILLFFMVICPLTLYRLWFLLLKLHRETSVTRTIIIITGRFFLSGR